ncbi:MAG: DUF1343 domain-containing protein [Ignavibacteriaceae bacterium]|nr:DUF1343 domain-containing protein [Ignavibacteriaceae bacterium]
MAKLFFYLLLFTSFLAAQSVVKTGIEVLRDSSFGILSGKRVGLITNPTGVDSKLKATIDILYGQPQFRLAALYGPEHGVRGDYSAGDLVSTYTDSSTGLTVFSLYGKTRKPTPEMLESIDVLVFDIQDIGSRSYTYISTLGLAMEAAAEKGIEFVVLDRPNPLTGLKIEGNIAEDGYHSFVSQFKIPYVHGLTVGELAILLNETGMLKDGVKCKLTVVPMSGWKREMTFRDTGLPWVMTSPHIPYLETPFFYVATGILGELGYISEGVGYTIPFQALAAEWINQDSLANAMNALNLPAIIFRPIIYKPYYGKNAGKNLKGVQLHFTDPLKCELMKIQFHFLEVHNRLYPERNPFIHADSSRFSMFDKVTGTSNIREIFSKEMTVKSIESYLDKDVEAFRKISSAFYLY